MRGWRGKGQGPERTIAARRGMVRLAFFGSSLDFFRGRSDWLYSSSVAVFACAGAYVCGAYM